MTPPPADRRLLWIVAAGAAVLLAILLVLYAAAHRRGTKAGAHPSEHGELQVRMGAVGTGKLDPKAPLRCFVEGRFVGELPLEACAQRNGTDPGRLGVGVDSTGQVAASSGGAELAPLPGRDLPGALADETAAAPRDPAPAAECLRYGAAGWRSAGVGLTLRACARVLFENRCVRPGEAVYGRYGPRTLRLVPGRVEVSPNNRDFDLLMDQDAEGCSLDE